MEARAGGAGGEAGNSVVGDAMSRGEVGDGAMEVVGDRGEGRKEGSDVRVVGEDGGDVE